MEYIERMRRDDGSKYDARKPTRLSLHSADLTKKVRTGRAGSPRAKRAGGLDRG